MIPAFLARRALASDDPRDGGAPDGALLVAGVRAGDPQAFQQLFHAYYQPLYHFAFRYLHSADDAEDAVQTVFVRIWNARSEWHVAGTVTDYLHLAVRNACKDKLRHYASARRWREKRVEELRHDLNDGAHPFDTVEEELADADADAIMQRSIDELPPKRREVFVLRFTHGMSYAAIAARLRVAPKTVETQISRALKQVRQSMKAHHPK